MLALFALLAAGLVAERRADDLSMQLHPPIPGQDLRAWEEGTQQGTRKRWRAERLAVYRLRESQGVGCLWLTRRCVDEAARWRAASQGSRCVEPSVGGRADSGGLGGWGFLRERALPEHRLIRQVDTGVASGSEDRRGTPSRHGARLLVPTPERATASDTRAVQSSRRSKRPEQEGGLICENRSSLLADRWLAAAWALSGSVAVEAETFASERSDISDTPDRGWTDVRNPLPLGTKYSGSLPSMLAEAQLRDLICSPEFTWPCDWALRTVVCESSFNLNAYSTETINGITYEFIGPWQVLGGSYDPYTNTAQAHIQYVQWQRGERPTSPWPNCP